MVPASGHFVGVITTHLFTSGLFREASVQSSSLFSLPSPSTPSGDIGKKVKADEMWLLYLKKHNHEHFHFQS